MRKVPAVVMLAVLIAAGCNETESPTGPGTGSGSGSGTTQLTGHTWTLVSAQRNGQPVSVSGASRYTLRFETSGNLAVRSDCNSCAGTYTANGAALRTSGLACTRAFCGDTSFDAEFTRAVGEASTFQIEQNTLTIASGAMTLRFGNVILPPSTAP